jgi:hypothetical protein
MLRLLFIASLICWLPPGAVAQTVYRSVQNGVTSFSDAPPPQGEAEVIVVDAPPVSGDVDLEERLAAMRETTDRMAEDRRERERHRAELRALRDEAQVASPPRPVEAQPALAYWPVARPFSRPPLRPHPPLRPYPVPPGWSVMKPGNAQLMRPVVSTRSARQVLR